MYELQLHCLYFTCPVHADCTRRLTVAGVYLEDWASTSPHPHGGHRGGTRASETKCQGEICPCLWPFRNVTSSTFRFGGMSVIPRTLLILENHVKEATRQEGTGNQRLAFMIDPHGSLLPSLVKRSGNRSLGFQPDPVCVSGP